MILTIGAQIVLLIIRSLWKISVFYNFSHYKEGSIYSNYILKLKKKWLGNNILKCNHGFNNFMKLTFLAGWTEVC